MRVRRNNAPRELNDRAIVLGSMGTFKLRPKRS
jgi:hypothetical protein